MGDACDASFSFYAGFKFPPHGRGAVDLDSGREGFLRTIKPAMFNKPLPPLPLGKGEGIEPKPC
jgi:hypothetical protein